MITVIVGGTAGLGKALALQYQKQGQEVVVVGRRRAKLPFCESVVADVSGKDISSLLLALSDIGNINRLVWAAGQAQQEQLGDINDDNVRKLLQLNVSNFIRTVSHLWNKDQLPEKILGVTSTSAHTPRAKEPVYAAAKAAQSQFLQSIAVDVDSSVYEFAPAGMRSEFWSHEPRKDLAVFLDPDWVAQQIIKLESANNYGGWKILRDPLRCERIW